MINVLTAFDLKGFGRTLSWPLCRVLEVAVGQTLYNSASDVINPLKVCYEALDPVEKEVFLDIGCFLVGEERELAVRVLEGLYENNRIVGHLESLRQKCLVDVHGDEYGSVKITMHNQVRDLARHIAREELRALPTLQPLRLSSSDDVQQMLQSQVCKFD